jgi:hypothetical protein
MIAKTCSMSMVCVRSRRPESRSLLKTPAAEPGDHGVFGVLLHYWWPVIFCSQGKLLQRTDHQERELVDFEFDTNTSRLTFLRKWRLDSTISTSNLHLRLIVLRCHSFLASFANFEQNVRLQHRSHSILRKGVRRLACHGGMDALGLGPLVQQYIIC